MDLSNVQWSFPIQLVETSTRKDTRLSIGDDASAMWKDELVLEFLRIDSFVQLTVGATSILFLVPIWYERLGECPVLQVPRVRKYHTRNMQILKGEPIPVHLLREQVLAAHDCNGPSKGAVGARVGKGPPACSVARVCHRHLEAKCGSCQGAVEYGQHLVHTKQRLEYYIVSKQDGFIKDSEQLNLDWMSKC